MHGLEKKLQIAGTEFTVRELTTGEIRNWLKALENEEIDLVGAYLFEDFSQRDLALMTGESQATLDALTPSQTRLLMDASREVNADFFRMRAQIAQLGAQLMTSGAAG